MEYVYNPPTNTNANYYDLMGNESFEGQYPGTQPAWTAWLFGDRGALSDREAWNLNQQAKFQEQALQVDLMNYANKYNSPIEQMLRYQEAGLSPWLAYSQQQTPSASPPGVSSARAQAHGSSSPAQLAQASNGLISQMLGIARAGAEMYDYLKYGDRIRNANVLESEAQAYLKHSESKFKAWLNRYSGVDAADAELGDLAGDWDFIRHSIRGQQEQAKLRTSEERIKQIQGMISLIPDEKARKKALLDLDQYRLGIMKGQNDAILNIDTGFPGFDSFLRLVAYFLMGQKL